MISDSVLLHDSKAVVSSFRLINTCLSSQLNRFINIIIDFIV